MMSHVRDRTKQQYPLELLALVAPPPDADRRRTIAPDRPCHVACTDTQPGLHDSLTILRTPPDTFAGRLFVNLYYRERFLHQNN